MMRPFRHLAWLLFFLQCFPAAFGESEEWKKVAEDYRKAAGEWKAVQAVNGERNGDPARHEAAVRALKPLLKIRQEVGPPWENEQERVGFELMDWMVAKDWADAGKYEDSLRCLKEQVAEGGILQNTRNPNYFATDVFALHAKIMAETGKVADIPESGYKVFAVPSAKGLSRYAFVWEPEGDDIGGVLVQGVAEDEQRQEITLFECGKSKHCRYVGDAQVVSKRGKLKASIASRPGEAVLVLSGVVKVLELKGEGRMPFVHPSSRPKIELLLDQEDLERPLDAIARMDRKSEESK
jgi:hypothetical protein